MRKNIFFCKNVLQYTIINIFMQLEIIISKFSCILKTMSRNNFPEPQPDSASFKTWLFVEQSLVHQVCKNLNIPEYTWMYLNIPEYTWIYLNLPEYSAETLAAPPSQLQPNAADSWKIIYQKRYVSLYNFLFRSC